MQASWRAAAGGFRIFAFTRYASRTHPCQSRRWYTSQCTSVATLHESQNYVVLVTRKVCCLRVYFLRHGPTDSSKIVYPELWHDQTHADGAKQSQNESCLAWIRTA